MFDRRQAAEEGKTRQVQLDLAAKGKFAALKVGREPLTAGQTVLTTGQTVLVTAQFGG
jgi:hypothetical protein